MDLLTCIQDCIQRIKSRNPHSSSWKNFSLFGELYKEFRQNILLTRSIFMLGIKLTDPGIELPFPENIFGEKNNWGQIFQEVENL